MAATGWWVDPIPLGCAFIVHLWSRFPKEVRNKRASYNSLDRVLRCISGSLVKGQHLVTRLNGPVESQENLIPYEEQSHTR